MYKIAIGSDHRGFKHKQHIIDLLTGRSVGFKAKYIFDVGTHSSASSVDYPVIAHDVADAILHDEHKLGILICGSGIGVCMAANRYRGIRAVTCREQLDAVMARKHNNANVLCIGADFTPLHDVESIVQGFLRATFEGHKEGGERHMKRVELMDTLPLKGDIEFE
jgi:ribose 5-phosphate isomerase B